MAARPACETFTSLINKEHAMKTIFTALSILLLTSVTAFADDYSGWFDLDGMWHVYDPSEVSAAIDDRLEAERAKDFMDKVFKTPDQKISIDELAGIHPILAKMSAYIDKDKDGYVSRDEMSSFYATYRTMTPEKIFEIADTNKDGELSMEETSVVFPVSPIRFTMIDVDKNGSISMTEYKLFKEQRGRERGRFFDAADKDKDGKLSKQEFTAGFPKLADRFEAFDGNKDSFVSRDEMYKGWQAYKDVYAEKRFNDSDANKDGMLSKDEFSTAFPRLADKFGSLDKNADGFITFQELLDSKGKHISLRGKHFGERIFMDADTNKDGKLSRDEFKAAFPKAIMFDNADTDGDGFITFEDLWIYNAPSDKADKQAGQQKSFEDNDEWWNETERWALSLTF